MLQSSPTPQVFELHPADLLAGLQQVIRESQLKYKYKEVSKLATSHLDNAIKETERNLTNAEIASLSAKLFTQIMSRSVRQGLSALSKYYHDGKTMDKNQLIDEKHKPDRLSRFMKSSGITRPVNTAAHAIISGAHERATAARKILAKWKIRIDDPDNGVFLPKNSDYTPHPQMPQAVNHAAIHTKEYYVNITAMLTPTKSEEECRLVLKLIGKMLQQGTLEY